MTTPISKDSKMSFLEERWLEVIPQAYAKFDFDNVPDINPELVEFGKKWICETPLKSLFFYGKWGCGKTSFSYALIRELLKHKRYSPYFWPRYVDGHELDSKLLHAMLNGGDSYLIQDYSKQDLLFIDDIDKTTGKDRFKMQLFQIINNRYSNQLPTIITSNCNPNELAEIFDGSVLSRLSDDDKWQIIEMSGSDLRKNKVRKF